jgi:hypothetical protein
MGMIGDQSSWLSNYTNGLLWVRLIGAAFSRLTIWPWWEHSRQITLLGVGLVSSRTALHYLAAESKWGREKDKNTVVREAIRELERAARSGEIQVLGRPRHTVYFETIKPHYWRTAGLDAVSHARIGTRPRTELREWSPPNAVEYEDLLLARARVEHLWPR